MGRSDDLGHLLSDITSFSEEKVKEDMKYLVTALKKALATKACTLLTDK